MNTELLAPFEVFFVACPEDLEAVMLLVDTRVKPVGQVHELLKLSELRWRSTLLREARTDGRGGLR